MGKTKIFINCDICEARKIVEENYSDYENIMLNADFMLVDERSKAVLSRLPITSNVDEILECAAEEEVNVQSVNGKFTISGTTQVEDNTILAVNGKLEILPNTQEVLKKYKKITINGAVLYPQSMMPYLTRMTMNGAAEVYPDDCIRLDKEFVIDKYFPMRAKQNGRYYAKRRIMLTDPEVNAAMLADKNVSFLTEEVIVSEEKAMECAQLFDESVKFVVVPAGEGLIPEDLTLDDAAISKYGTRIFVAGDLTLNSNSRNALSKLEKITVLGTVYLTRKLLEDFQKLQTEYQELVLVKEVRICNKPSITIDRAMLERAPEGIEIANCARVRLDEAITPEIIEERLAIKNCAFVQCTPKQLTAVERIGENVAYSGGQEGSEDTGDLPGGMFGSFKDKLAMMKDAKFVNADRYVL